MINEIKTILQIACLTVTIVVLIIAGAAFFQLYGVLGDFKQSFIFEPIGAAGLERLESIAGELDTDIVEELPEISREEIDASTSEIIEEVEENTGLEITGMSEETRDVGITESNSIEETKTEPLETEKEAAIPEIDTANICDRTPEIQQRLIEMLQINSCRDITGEELVRVQDLSLSEMPLKDGDLDSFINLTNLRLSTEEAPVGLLDDLVSLEKLELGLEVPPSPGSFENLGRLREMRLSIDDRDETQYDDNQYNAEELNLKGVFEGLAALERLVLEVRSDNYAVVLTNGSMTGMPTLQELEIHNIGRVEAGALNDLPALRSANLQLENLPDYLPKPNLPENIFAGHPDLTYLRFYGWGEITRLEFNSLDVVCRIEGDVVPYHYYDRDFTAVVGENLVKRSDRQGRGNDEWECKLRLAPVDTDNWDIENWEEVVLTVPPLPESRRS